MINLGSRRLYFWVIVCFFLITLGEGHRAQATEAALKPLGERPSVTVHLEYPQGRFREDASPKFFKWSVRGVNSSLALKIYRLGSTSDQRSRLELIKNFDFMGSVDSLNLPEGALPVGKYRWSVSVFDDQSPQPIATDELSFEIAALTAFSLKTNRVGFFAGASRGTYSSVDPTYAINFDTTPNSYGLFLAGSQNRKIWQTTLSSSDYILKGSVFRSYELTGEYAWAISKENAHVQFYLGPTARLLIYPQARTTDGISLATKNLTAGLVGVELAVETQIDQFLDVYAKISADLPALASQSIDYTNGFGSYAAHAGLMFGQFWPLGLGGDIGYESNKISTKDRSDSVGIKQDRISIQINVSYAL